MEQAEQETLIAELETRIDRLRALYDQYFMGLEKLEPGVPRKDVERRIQVLRKEQIRNTGLRFRFQMILQRYNTYQTYWQRICREIENGTFKRHMMRAQAKLDAAPREEKRKPVETTVDAESLPSDDAALEEAFAELEAMPKKKRAVEVDLDFDSFGALGDPMRRPPSSLEMLAVRQPTPRPPAPPSPPPLARPVSAPVPAPAPAPAAAPGRVWRKAMPSAPRLDEEAKTAPKPSPAPPPLPVRDAPPPPVRASTPAPTSPRATPPPVPARPAAAKPASAELPDDRVRQLYAQYVETKRKQNESTAAITYEGLAKSLRESSAKLREKHGKSVDFEVAVKDGKTILKPVVK